MSENKKKPVQPSQYAIVNKIAVLLDQGDYAHIQNFVSKTVKTLEREKDTFIRNKENYMHNHTGEALRLQEDIDDANSVLEDTYLDIDPKNVNTNEKRRTHMDVYLGKIEKCEKAVEAAEELLKDAEDALQVNLDDCDDEITLRKDRIKKLSK